jgi:hypothetical protein
LPSVGLKIGGTADLEKFQASAIQFVGLARKNSYHVGWEEANGAVVEDSWATS